jgi:putative transposase
MSDCYSWAVIRLRAWLRSQWIQRHRKRTYHLYSEAGLAVRGRKRKRIGPFERKPLPKPAVVNRSWAMDFIADGLCDGRLRRLVIVDDWK